MENLGECKMLARNRKGLAINYAWETRTANLFTVNVEVENGTNFPRKTNRKDIADQPEEFFNCLVFDCPETVNMTAMVNDSRFDYYSLYTNPPRKYVFGIVKHCSYARESVEVNWHVLDMVGFALV